MSILDVFAYYPLVFVAVVFVFSLLVGSFLNVVIYRLPLMMEQEWQAHCQEMLNPEKLEPDSDQQVTAETFNLAVPRSACPHCGHQITALENIPVISYLFLGGKCSGCKAPISIRYPLVELSCGLISAYIAYQAGFSIASLALILLSWVLICLTMIDYDHQLLPDNLTLPLMWLGLLLNTQGLFTDLNSAVWGAIAGYLSLWSVYWAFKLLTGKEGMGYGDFKLLAALGAWGGWQILPLIIILSSFVGAVLGVLLITLQGRDSAKPIPFGPFLAIAGWIALLWGDQITQNYFQLIGL